MNLEDEQRRGGEARRMLETDVFKAAREDVYGQLRAARLAAPTTDTLLHSKLILMEQVADRFFGYFEQLAQTGQMADMELSKQRDRWRDHAARIQAYQASGRNGI